MNQNPNNINPNDVGINNNITPQPIPVSQPVEQLSSEPDNLMVVPNNNETPVMTNNVNPVPNVGPVLETNNQSYNSTLPIKKSKARVIVIILLLLIAVGAGVYFIPKLLNGSVLTNDNIIKLQKVTTFENYNTVSKCGEEYFALSDYNKTIVINPDGKTMASGSFSSNGPYCSNDGTIIMTDFINNTSSDKNTNVWKNGEVVFSFNNISYDINMYYEDSIIYYTNEDEYVVAYNVNESKTLWTSKIKGYNPIVLENVVILTSEKNSNDNIILNKKNGDVIVSNNDSNIYASYSNYYIKTKESDNTLSSLEVYSFDNSLVSKLNINTSDVCKFGYVLSNGYYLVSCIDTQGNNTYSIYDYNSNAIKKGLDYKLYYHKSRVTKNGNIVASINVLDNEKFSFVSANDQSKPSYIVYNDGKVLEYYYHIANSYDIEDLTKLKSGQQMKYILGINKEKESMVLTNLFTGEQKIVSQKNQTYISKQLTDGKYFMLDVDEEYMFYDENLNKLEYKTKAKSYTVNSEWISLLRVNPDKEGEYIYYHVNLATSEKIDTDLELPPYSYINSIYDNKKGIITFAKNKATLFKYI